MANLIEIEKDIDVINSFRPDFSVFSTPVISWVMNLGSSIDNEDYMSITFAGLGLYKGKSFVRGQKIEIKIEDRVVILFVRQVQYSIRNLEAQTTVILKTNKLQLDQYIKDGLSIGVNHHTASAVFKKIFGELGIDINVKGNMSIHWPIKKGTKEVSITGRQNILKWIKEQLGKNPPFDWWIDIYNNLNIRDRLDETGSKKTLDFNIIQPIFSSFVVSITDRFNEYEINTAYNSNLPDEYKTEANLYTNAVDPKSGKYGTVNVKDRKVKARAGTNENNDMPAKSLKSSAVKNQDTTLVLSGLHYIDPHTKITLKNFQLGDGDYLLKTISINDFPAPQTSLTLETMGVDLGKRKDVDVEEDEGKKDDNQAVLNKPPGKDLELL